jgi:hypothetical protein
VVRRVLILPAVDRGCSVGGISTIGWSGGGDSLAGDFRASRLFRDLQYFGALHVSGDMARSQGERLKEWRNACQEADEHRYGCASVSASSVEVSLCRHYFEHGGDPESWLEVRMREKNLEHNDRVLYERHWLVRAYKHGCCYGQLGPGACVVFEVLGRRIVAVVDAYSANGSRLNRGLARFLMDGTSLDDGLRIGKSAAHSMTAQLFVDTISEVEDEGRCRRRGWAAGCGRGLRATPPIQ